LLLGGCLPIYTAVLGPGKPALPIVGQDASGQPVKLEDYPGKVVLLHFGHAACPPCRAMIRRERVLAERYRDRPFAILGVSADPTPEVLRAFEQQEGITWRTLWDGSNGPVASLWEVEAYPTLVIVDREGLVRYRHVGLPPEGEVEARVAELLKEKKKG
jgi:peroxiredoxin